MNLATIYSKPTIESIKDKTISLKLYNRPAKELNRENRILKNFSDHNSKLKMR